MQEEVLHVADNANEEACIIETSMTEKMGWERPVYMNKPGLERHVQLQLHVWTMPL